MLKCIKVFEKVVIAMVICFFVMSSFYSVKAITLSDMQSKAKDFISKGQDNSGDIDINEFTKDFADLGKILTTVGAGVIVAVVTYMGIKYLTAGPEAQAKLKTQLIGVAVSGLVIFGAYNIWKVVVQVAKTF